MEDFTLALSGNKVVFIAFVFVFVVFSIFIYRKTNPPVPQWLKNILIGIRLLALLIILFILFEPILNLSWYRSEKPIVAVLLDTSASMSLKDLDKSRAEKAITVLNAPVFQDKNKDLKFEFYHFSTNLKELLPNQIDSLKFDGDGTDLTAALKQLYEKNVDRYLKGIVLLSDGIVNLGGNPLRFVEEINAPIFPISVGEPIDKSDIVIKKIMTNQVTYANNEVPVDVTVHAIGYSGKKIKVNLFEGNQLIDSKYIELGELPETKVRLKFTPGEPGYKKYRVTIPAQEKEFTTVNNQKSFYVKVLKSRMKLLYIAGAPCPDFSFIRRILKSDPNMETDFWIAKKHQGFYQGVFPVDMNQLKKYDCIILHNFPVKGYSTNVISTIRGLIEEKQTPLFIIFGGNINYRAFDPIKASLPFSVPIFEGMEILVFPGLTQEGVIHPITRIKDEEFENRSLWDELPPIFYSVKKATLYPNTVTLVTAKPYEKRFARPGQARPLVVIRKFGKQKSMAILGYGIYRWDLMMWGVGKSNLVFKQLLNQSVRWLINKEDSKTVRIYPTQEIFRSGQPVSFSAEVYTENYQPLDGAEVKLTVQSDSNSYEISLTNVGDGKYEGSLPALTGGDYTFSGKAIYKNISMGEDKGRFSVENFNLEYLQTRIDENFLKQLALKSGGQYIADSSLTSLKELLSFPPQNILESREWQLWNKIYLLIIVIVLLSIEWFIRKRTGML